ncbi:hypothetical protein [Bradyrhizobium sp. JYMT SZCCT0180]|jgi:hypothetical protein|uniref:hypothetical protein n=1 Tax=Bradyrhizobium sp. JYMT SZCCT0180 TaxID=2807666 RepID=UPI001BABDB05|nr:hypothetical protein [Bradyrhizobium sp. JYMT SZCCT0180]MBR1216246.1 hypothetical protein [Bradyrhizobium sp. JYMT SZCCT0180]
MVQSIVERVSSVIDLEGEIEAEFRRSPPVHERRPVIFTPPRVHEPTVSMADTSSMPDYVEHREGATEIGKLTAEAIVREYEAAAKDIEAMGAELIERVKQCEAMTRDALAVTLEMRETAARYREEAKRIFVQIEDCSLMTAEVRKTCSELKERIAAPVV